MPGGTPVLGPCAHLTEQDRLQLLLQLPTFAMVARLVPKRDVIKHLQAIAACKAEWDKLKKRLCWDESLVEEWDVVKARADAAGLTIHIGELLELCYLKGSELPEDHPDHKYKGRVVF